VPQQIGRKCRKTIKVALRRAELDCHILTLGIAGFVQAGMKSRDLLAALLQMIRRPPITGTAGCCVRAASGHVAAAPPKSVMNLRRLMPHPQPGGGYHIVAGNVALCIAAKCSADRPLRVRT